MMFIHGDDELKEKMGIIEKCSHYHIEKLRKKMIKFVE
jgi:hypothetical protein